MKNNEKMSEELADIVWSTIKKLVKIADENNIDRDDIVKYYSTLFASFAAIGTFVEISPEAEDSDDLMP